jgi:nucleoid-associated protein YgaU
MPTIEQAQQAVQKRRNELEALKAEAGKHNPSSQAYAGMAQQMKVLEGLLQRAEKELAEAQSGAAAEKAAAAQRAKWKRHTVAAGETLSHISLKYYKTANRWKEIYEANKDVIGENHNLIKPGQELVIPETEA